MGDKLSLEGTVEHVVSRGAAELATEAGGLLLHKFGRKAGATKEGRGDTCLEQSDWSQGGRIGRGAVRLYTKRW